MSINMREWIIMQIFFGIEKGYNAKTRKLTSVNCMMTNKGEHGESQKER